jgi:hypothetical protein
MVLSCAVALVGLVQVGEMLAAEGVALRLPLPEAVVTWLATDQDDCTGPGFHVFGTIPGCNGL